MDRRASIVYGKTGQVVEFYPPEAVEGVPSVATVSVWAGTQSNDDTAEYSPTPTIDATSITMDAAGGFFNHEVSRKRLFLPNVSGLVVARSYLAQNLVSQREVVRLSRISSSAPICVDGEHDLVHDYPIGSSLLGMRIYFTVDPTWVADESNINPYDLPYRVRWRYTVAGVVRDHWTYLDLVTVAKQHGVTVESLLEEWPTLWYQLGPDDRVAEAGSLIRAAWDRVEMDLRLAGTDPNTLRDSGMLDMLVRAAAMEVLGRQRGTCPPGRDLEQFIRESAAIYHRDFEKAVAGNKLTRAADNGTGAIDSDPVRVGWFTS